MPLLGPPCMYPQKRSTSKKNRVELCEETWWAEAAKSLHISCARRHRWDGMASLNEHNTASPCWRYTQSESKLKCGYLFLYRNAEVIGRPWISTRNRVTLLQQCSSCFNCYSVFLYEYSCVCLAYFLLIFFFFSDFLTVLICTLRV